MKKLFSEALKEYSAYKESTCGDGKVTVAEVKQLREEFKRVRKETSKENSYKDASTKRNFAKVVKDFADFKEQQTGTRSITSAEIAMLREGLKTKSSRNPEMKNHRISEAKVQKNNSSNKEENSFDKFVEKYVNYKSKKTGSNILTIQERMKLRNQFNKINEAKKSANTPAEVEPKTLKEAIIAYSNYKKANCGESKVSREEFDAIKKEFKESKNKNATPENKNNAKVENAPDGNAIVKSLKEAADCVRMGRRALKEGDLPLAQDMAAQAGNAVDAATGAAPDATAIDPVLAQKITDVKVAIDDLATAAGVSTPVDLGANVAANIPPVEGQPVPDATTAAAPAPVQENKIDVDAVMARINERKAAVDNKDNPYNVKDVTAGDPTGIDKMEFATAGNETNPSLLAKIPSAQALAKGSDKNVTRFGKDETYTPPKGVQAVGTAKKESKSLDEQDVDRYLEKLDFKKIFSQSNGVIDAPEC